MNKLEQRLAIAESVGWRHREGGMWYCPDGGTLPEDQIPNYLNDLNAVHEVEKNLPVLYRNCYIDNLVILIFGEQAQVDGSYAEQWAILNSTAAQRAEAYLRTIGKWRD